uniref:Uncharacterized protein n=1 Tax=Glossina brevipalpis TaxID=37001 RepID=A0A1A9W4J2_9MUSC
MYIYLTIKYRKALLYASITMNYLFLCFVFVIVARIAKSIKGNGLEKNFSPREIVPNSSISNHLARKIIGLKTRKIQISCALSFTGVNFDASSLIHFAGTETRTIQKRK